MILTNLSLQNFRSFSKKSLAFSSKTTVIVGPNTVGKTNILEAIYLLATGKSFRAEEEKEIISYGEEIARIKGIIRKSSATSAFISYIGKQKVQIDQKSETTDLSGFRFEPTAADSAELSELELILTTGQIEGIQSPHKKLLVNGVPKRMVDFVGNLRAVLFWPEDLELVTDSPSLRRKYLDLVLCQVDGEYSRCLLAYEKGVRQRNKLLERIRDEGAPRSQLTFWNQLLIKNGNVLTEKRTEYIDFINGENRHSRDSERSAEDSRISSSSSEDGVWTHSASSLQLRSGQAVQASQNDVVNGYQISYDKSIISESRLEQYVQNEIGAAVTLVGPHRDDVRFMIRHSRDSERSAEDSRISSSSSEDGVWTHSASSLQLRSGQAVQASQNDEKECDLSLYGSRGEQRMAILWLKLGELEFMSSKTDARPILLLDDIFSELDREHREAVLRVIPHQQTIITTTDLHLVDKQSFSANKKFLKSAKIIEL